MPPKILFNIATRARSKKFYNVIANIMEMVSGDSYQFLVKVDDDDPDKAGYIFTNDKMQWMWGKSDSKIHAINRNIPSSHRWDIIVDVSDDFVFTKKGFDDIIRKHCGPDDCLHFPEPFAQREAKRSRNEDIIIMACMGRKYYERFGYIFNPEYKSLFCDNELTAVAKLLGRYKYVNQSIFYHAHPQAGFGKADAQTIHTESFWDVDKKTYEERKAKNFDI